MQIADLKNNISLLYLLLVALSAEAKTVIVNSMNPTGNYGALSGAHFDANGNFISDEMSLPVAIWLTSGANLCASPGDQRYKQYCGADTILFDINPKYAGGQTKGPYVLTLSQGVQLYDKVFIDGFSQPGASKGNPMIYITGTDNDTWQISAHKTYGDASGTHIRGTGVINTKNHAFYVSSVHDVLIEDNYVGVNTDGSASTGLQKGIHIGDGANNITVQNNVFSGANLNAIEMNPGTNQLTQTMGTPHDIHIIGNMIGTDITGTKGDPKYGNKGTGININGATGNIEIKGNIIGYNGSDPKANQSGTNGIDISNSTGITISNNFIGVGADGITKMPNEKNGIAVWHGTGGSNKNIVIENNNISNNKGNGVEISGGNNSNVRVGKDINGVGNENIISYNTKDGIHLENYGTGGPNNIPFRINSIFCNGGKGIAIASGSNNAIATPVIDLVNSTASPVKIVGSAPANSKVDLYMVDPNCFNCAGGGAANENQGKTYVGSVDADASGKWIFPCGSGITGAVVAHATTSINNSSEFSNIFKINCTPPLGKLVATLVQPSEICDGGTTVLNTSHTIDKTNFPNVNANATYVFYVDGVKIGQNSTGSFTPLASAFHPPKAFVEVQIIYTKEDTGLCFDLSEKDFKWININAKLSPPDAGSDDTICAGKKYTLSGDAKSFPSILWTSTGDGSFSDDTKSNATYTPGNNDVQKGFVKLSMSGKGSCNSDADEMILWILPSSKTHILNDTGSCNKQDITLDAGSGFTSYLWTPSGAKTQKITVTIPGDYYLTVTDANGCIMKDTAKITFHSLPQVNIGTNKTQVHFCEGKSAILKASGVATDPINKNVALKYLWTPSNSSTQNLLVTKGGDYVVTITDGNDCKNSDTVNVTVDPIDVADFTIDDYCDYSASPSPIKVSGFTSGGTFSIVSPTALGNTSINPSTGNISNGKGGTTYTVQYVTKGLCPDTAQDLVTINPTPVIQKNPDPISICGGNASFKITASGVGVYQWQEKKTGEVFSDIVNGANYNGANNDQLNLSNVTQIMDGYQYRCVLSAGICIDTSTAALLTISSLTSVNDPSPQTICEGKNTSFTVVPVGMKSMSWEFSSDNGTTYATVLEDSVFKNVHFPTLLINGTTKNMDGYLFRAHVIGCIQDASSKNAKLTVLSSPTITKDLEDQKICATSAATFAVAAPNATSYKWQVSKDEGKTFTNIANENTATLILQNVNTGMNGFQYRVQVLGNCDPVFSKAAILKVDTTIVSASADRLTICVGQTATITAVANPSNAKYQWLSGENSAEIAVSPKLGSSVFSVTATANGCVSKATPITINVSPKPEVNAGEDQVVCPQSEIILGQNTNGNQTYSWISVDDDFKSSEANPKAKIKERGVYVVNARNSACPDGVTDTVLISTLEAPTLFIPNAFTPNSDGTNDIFKIAGEGITEFNGSIYNRWGELIFEWNDAGDGWNGITKNNLVQEDVYVYKINVKNLCDTKKGGKNILGSVTVIR